MPIQRIKTVGRLVLYFYSDTIRYGAKFINITVTGVILKVGGFGEGFVKFHYLEVCKHAQPIMTPKSVRLIILYLGSPCYLYYH